MAQLRNGGTPNVSVPSGAIYPNGVEYDPADPVIQSTVRPAGTVFRASAGYRSIRPGRTRMQAGYHGLGIHFTPQRFAEDVGQHGSPLLVDTAHAAEQVDIADLPDSDRLDDNGRLDAATAESNGGPYLAEGTHAPTGGVDVRESERTLPDMGDRSPGRPLSGKFWNAVLHDPTGMFRSEYRENPVIAVGIAGVFVGLAYALGVEVERQWSARSRGRGAAGAVGVAPAAAVAASGDTVKQAASVVNDAATAAGKAAETAASAAGDVAEAAGKAVDKAADAVADAGS